MKKHSALLIVTLTMVCVGIISIVAVSAFNRKTAAYCPSQPGNLLPGGNVASANGSGHNGNFTLSFGAFDHGSGNVTGQATFIDEGANTKMTVDVECLFSGQKTAMFGGTIQRSTNPNFTSGSEAMFQVEDNGEGTNAPPDQFSLPFIGSCGGAQTSAPGLLPSDAGNIQVRFVAPNKDCSKCPFGTHCAGNGECVGGGGGGGGNQCPTGYRDCCGSCVPVEIECPACPATE
jgi:hypothetical protein